MTNDRLEIQGLTFLTWVISLPQCVIGGHLGLQFRFPMSPILHRQGHRLLATKPLNKIL